MKKGRKQNTKTRKTITDAKSQRRVHAHHSEQLRARVRSIVDEVVAPQVILDEIWQHNVDLDKLVDDYARSHYAEGYRLPSVQKKNIDKQIGSTEANKLFDNMYSRFLLAADVGFELGFAAANRLNRGAR